MAHHWTMSERKADVLLRSLLHYTPVTASVK